MEASMIKLFIVIVNWNGVTDTLTCLESLSRANWRGIEGTVVLVDNGSTDDSLKKLAKWKSSAFSLHIIKKAQNLGFAGGNNVGISYAMNKNPDYIVLLNNDTIVDREIFIHFVNAAQRNPKAGILSPKIYFAKGYEFHKDRYANNQLGKVLWSVGGNIDWNNVYAPNRGVDEVDTGQYDKTRPVDFATGACMLVRPEVFAEIGMFDEKYFLYLEDVDLCMRAKKKDYKVVYTPEPVVWHKVSQSSAIGGGLNDYYTTRNRLLFARRYAPLRAQIAVVREAARFVLSGRPWQKQGAIDYFMNRFGKGSWK